MELNTATLTAGPAALDLFSLIPTLGATPAASTNSSAPIAQDFSAMLTEMIGPTAGPGAGPAAGPIAGPVVGPIASPAAGPIAGLAASSTVSPIAGPAVPQIPGVAVPEVPQVAQSAEPLQPQLPQLQPVLPEAAGAPPKAQGPEKKAAVPLVDPTLTVPVPSPLQVASMLTPVVAGLTESTLQTAHSLSGKVDEPAPAPAPTPAELAALPQPELERAFADLKSFEMTMHNETAKPDVLHPFQAQQAEAGPAQPTKLALVTTDPIANIQQQQLPPRVMPIPRIISDAKPERGKSDSLPSSNDTTATCTPTGQFTDLIRPVEQPDQVLAAHYVEVPVMPHAQVVRTVSMEVGDPGSQVTIRLQERGGDVTLQLNTGNEPLRQDLESSMGSLVNSLKQAQVQVSNVEVSRKSPIDKVRRMKEAR